MSHSNELTCAQCGAPNLASSSYCTTCGAALVPTEGKRTITHAVIAADSAIPSQDAPGAHPSSGRSRRLPEKVWVPPPRVAPPPNRTAVQVVVMVVGSLLSCQVFGIAVIGVMRPQYDMFSRASLFFLLLGASLLSILGAGMIFATFPRAGLASFVGAALLFVVGGAAEGGRWG